MSSNKNVEPKEAKKSMNVTTKLALLFGLAVASFLCGEMHEHSKAVSAVTTAKPAPPPIPYAY